RSRTGFLGPRSCEERNRVTRARRPGQALGDPVGSAATSVGGRAASPCRRWAAARERLPTVTLTNTMTAMTTYGTTLLTTTIACTGQIPDSSRAATGPTPALDRTVKVMIGSTMLTAIATTHPRAALVPLAGLSPLACAASVMPPPLRSISVHESYDRERHE